MDEKSKVERQQKAIEEVRLNLKEYLKPHHDDVKITKFLIARRYNVKGATDMLLRHILSGNYIGLDNILTDYIPPKKSLYFPLAELGFHKNGSIVRLLSLVDIDVKGLALSHTLSDATKYAAYIMEGDKRKQKLRFQETGEGGHDKHMYILDIKNIPWNLVLHRPTVQHFLFLLRCYEENYPESLKHAYVVNVPSFFSVIYGLIKTVIPMDILKKVDLVSPDKCADVLREVFDPSIIPASLGGTRTDPDGDPRCLSLFPVPPGSKVPKDYYLINTIRKDPNTKIETIHSNSTLKITLEVDTLYSVLIWYYHTTDHDIGMCVYFRPTGQKTSKCVVPMTRVNCHRFVETGLHPFEETGTCEVIFDNSYSWWTKKTLIYKLELRKPGEEFESLPNEI